MGSRWVYEYRRETFNYLLIMKKLLIFLVLVLAGCKSTQSTVKNKLDVVVEEVQTLENSIQLSQLDSSESEIILLTADPKLPTTITGILKLVCLKTPTSKKKLRIVVTTS